MADCSIDPARTDETMSTAEIIKALCRLEEAPWDDLKGKALDARGLAHRLKPYGISSKNLREGSVVAKGYARTDMVDAWHRYVSEAQREVATAATCATDVDPVADVAHVAASMGGGAMDGRAEMPQPRPRRIARFPARS